MKMGFRKTLGVDIEYIDGVGDLRPFYILFYFILFSPLPHALDL